jgi:hypothetical protein
MALNPNKWDFGPTNTVYTPLDIELVNTVPATHVIMMEWFGADASIIFTIFESFQTKTMVFWERMGLTRTQLTPLDIELVNTVPSPHVILMEWQGCHHDVILTDFGYNYGVADPFIPPFAGDFGGYLA